jgi:hypothetical protein
MYACMCVCMTAFLQPYCAPQQLKLTLTLTLQAYEREVHVLAFSAHGSQRISLRQQQLP